MKTKLFKLLLITFILTSCKVSEKVVCPSGEIVYHYKNPAENYKSFTKNFEAGLKGTVDVLEEVKIADIDASLKTKVTKLRNDLDQYSGRQSDILMTSIIKSNQFPCDKELRKRSDELYAQMQKHSAEVESLRLSIQNAVKEKDTLKTKAVKEAITEFTGVQEEIETNINKDVSNLDYTGKDEWVIVFTGDNNLEQAEYEISRLKKANIDDTKLVLRNGMFRSLSKSFTTKLSAQNYLNEIKAKVRKDVYIVNLKTWCPNKVKKERYFECE